jgi:flagellar M-ring protein FliF
MDLLNQAQAQIANLFRSMSAGARVVAGLLLAVVVVSLAFLFNHRVSGPDAYLMGGEPIAHDEVNRIVGALGKAGLKNFQVEGDRIRVPHGEEATYMAALVDEGALPGNFGSYLQKAVSDGGMLVPKAMQLERRQVAMQMELQNVIRKMKGIKSALVLYDVREERGLKSKPQFSASVTVSTHAGNALDEARVWKIRHLVASAIGMPPEGVTVTDLDGGSFPAGQHGAGPNDPYAQHMISYQKHWTDTIRQGLSYIPGVVVACNVELSDQIEQEDNRTRRDSKTDFGSATNDSKTFNSEAAKLAGPAVQERQRLVQPGQQPAGNEQRTKAAPLTPNRVSAVIGVPSSYIEQVWLERNPPQSGQASSKPKRDDLKLIEDEKIREIQAKVATLIPRPKEGTSNSIPQVHVTVFEKPAVESMPAPDVGQRALTWFGTHWSTLGTAMFGLLSLVMLRSMVRAAPAGEPLPAAMTSEAERGTKAETEARSVAASRLKRRDNRGELLREELAEIVRNDPETATNVLRRWVSSGN